MFHIGDYKQFWSGMFFLVLGIGTLAMLPPDIGTAAAMGPGYFPMLLGICLVGLGGASMVVGCPSRMGVRAGPVPILTIVSVLAGVWAFAGLINVGGLAVSLLCLVALSCADRLTRNPVEIGGIYAILLGMTWFIFIHVIQLPIKLFWWS